MSKFPNQLALVGVVGVSAIALSVGLSERAANKAGEAAHATAMQAAETGGTAADHAAPEAAVTETAEAAPEAAPAEAAETVAEAEAPAAEEVAAAEAPAADAATEQSAEAAAPVMGTDADTLDDKPLVASTMINGHGSTAEIKGSMEGGKFGLGRAALPEEIHAWTRNIMPDGRGLPEGSGSVEDGEMIFADYCAVCHGDFAEGVDNWPKLAGGMGTLNHEDPLKTVGSYWPYLSTTYDYVRRSMPFGNAQTLGDEEVYAIVAYILYSNDLVEDDFVLSKENFLEVEMPNAEGFFVDDRDASEYGQFSAEACMENCKDSVEITMHASVLDVTPEETKAKKISQMIKDTDPKSPKAEAAATGEAATEMAAVTPEETAPAEATPAEAVQSETAEPAADAAAPDPELVAAGETVFKKCKACHQVGEGATNRTGPVLNGVVGRTAGTAPDFKYSSAMAEAGAGGLVWNEETLSGYLAKPKEYLKGNKMSFAGLKKDDDIAAVIAYLEAHP